MDNTSLFSIGSGSVTNPDPEVENVHSEQQRTHLRVHTRAKLISEAIEMSKTSSYRRNVYSKISSSRLYRNVERDGIQAEANRALMRKDCFQANYNDYIPSDFDKDANERDRLFNIAFDDHLIHGPGQEKTFSIGNVRIPLDYLNSSLSLNNFNLTSSFVRSNITFNTNQFSINTSNQSISQASNSKLDTTNMIDQSSIGSSNMIGQSSIGSSNIIDQSSIGSGNVIEQSSIGSSNIVVQSSIDYVGPEEGRIPETRGMVISSMDSSIQQSTKNAKNELVEQTSIGSRSDNVIVDLIRNGMSPGEVAKLSDVFQHPSCFRNVSGLIIPWLQKQLKSGYWNNNSSLFILCLTMALSVGSVETIFKLNSTWGGLIFLFTYFIAYLFIVQPMLCFELGAGQLFRCSPFELFDKLFPGMGGVGIAMVILCLLSACIASSRTSAEYLIYFINVFKNNMIWDLSVGDIDQCLAFGTNALQCNALNPLCYMVDGHCKANKLGKAYTAYQTLFDNIDVDVNKIDIRLVIGISVTYLFVFMLHMIGLTNFTFFAFILVLVIFFLSHAQVYFSMLLDGSTSFVLDSITKIDYSLLYKNSRLWTHSVRCCIYEYVIGNGIYSTLATKSRIGYDLSLEAIGVGGLSGYIASLQFFSALAIVGYFSVFLSRAPTDILWMLEQDTSFILLPLGFVATHNMERTLLVLQFCCCFILVAFTISIQVEVILSTLTRFLKCKRVYIIGTLCVLLIVVCIPLCSRNGKRVIWFLEIAVGDLGRVFMVLMTCIVIGWLHNLKHQTDKLGSLTVYIFNVTFWIFNISATLGELLDESLPLYFWWIVRLVGILVATVMSLISYYFADKSRHNAKNISSSNTNTNINGVGGTKNKLSVLTMLYILFIGNIEGYRCEINRISPMHRTRNICWSVVWSVSIKWISCCLLSNSLADIVEEIISSDRVQHNIHTIPYNYKVITILLWLFLILIIVLYPIVKKKLFRSHFGAGIDLYDLPSYPSNKYHYKFNPKKLFKELF
uniref:Sodium:neurotransmitter symporter family, putative n=1 Tax=Theileria annulata TaxID=5874 RepID=A0A3B0NDY3_THEAN